MQVLCPEYQRLLKESQTALTNWNSGRAEIHIQRRGKPWQVVRVNVEKSASEPFEAPIYRVFLTNRL